MLVDAILIALILFFVFAGYKKGLMRTLLQVVSGFLSLVLAWVFYPIISKLIIITPLYDIISGVVRNMLPENYEPGSVFPGMPNAFNSAVADTVSEISANTIDAVVEAGTMVVINILSIIILFFVCRVAVILLRGIVTFIAKLPVIRQLDGLGGMLFGFFEGILLVYIILAILLFVPQLENIRLAVQNSYLTGELYNNNIVLNFIWK